MGERVLFLYLPTGGGHLSNAKAIADRIKADTGAETLLFDPISGRSKLGHFVLENGYRFVSLKVPFIWKALFAVSSRSGSNRLFQGLARLFARKDLARILDEWKPTRIVCVHHLLLSALSRALEGRPAVPTVVVATDPFEPPRIWAEGHQFPVFCYSGQAVETMVGYGVPRERLRAFSMIINDKFSTRMEPAASKSFMESQGLPTGKPLVLIAGGGDGIRGADRILEGLGRSTLDFAVAVVCGRDEATKARAEAVAGRLAAKGRTAVIYGFTDKMYELMGSADVVVSKGGPAVVGETLAAGKPNLVAFFIPGQEEANMRWVVDNGIGAYCPDPDIARIETERLLSDAEHRKGVEARIAALAFRSGTEDIARAVMVLA